MWALEERGASRLIYDDPGSIRFEEFPEASQSFYLEQQRRGWSAVVSAQNRLGRTLGPAE
jgi:hypothetical protein